MDDIGPSLPSDWKSDRKKEKSKSRGSASSPLESTIGPVLPQSIEAQDSDEIGPCLPPELALHASDSELEEIEEEESVSIGPAMPPSISGQTQRDSSDEDSYGPRLPPKQIHRRKDEDDDDDDAYGPTLPPSLSKSSSSTAKQNTGDSSEDDDSYGPALPPAYPTKPTDVVKGPSLPSHLPSHVEEKEEEEEDDMIGPLPWMMQSSDEVAAGQSAAEEFEARAQAMKDKLTGKNEPKAPQRESWMMELPSYYSKNFGLGPRQFRKRDLPDAGDRSVWTDTPADVARKEKEMREGKVKPKKAKSSVEEVTLSKRDQHLAEQISGYNQSKRAESLMDMHTKEREKQKEDEANKPKERRPFDREVDLQVNRFDEARKKNMMKKAGQLGERFSHSKEKMFL